MKWRDWFGPLFLAALALLPFYPLLWGGVHLETDYLDWMYPWRYSRVGHDSGACVFLANRELQDPLLAYYPMDYLANETLKRGEMPLWNPYQFCGFPMQAVGHPSMVDPLRLLLHWLLSPLTARECLMFVNLWLCGLFAYYYLRVMGLGRYAALLGGTTFMLGGYNLLRFEEEFFAAAAWHLVLALLLIEKTVRTRSAAWAAALAMGLGAIMLMGQWQLITYAMLATAGYAAWRLWSGESGAFLHVTGAFVIGLAGGCIQLLPTLELYAQSQRTPVTMATLFVSSRFLPENLFTLWWPDALGTPLHQFYLTRLRSGVQNYQELYAYVGVIPLALAVLACCERPRAMRCLWIPGLVALLYAMGTPGVTLLYWLLPGFKTFTPARILTIYVLCAALAAAFGMQRFLDGGFSARALRWGMVSWSAFTLLVLAFGALVQSDDAFTQALVMRYLPGGLLEMPTYCTDRATFTAQTLMHIRDHYAWSNPSLWLPLVLGWAGWTLLWLRRSGRVGLIFFQCCLLLIIATDLMFAGIRFNPTFPRASVAPPAAGLDTLAQARRGPYRVAALHRGIHPDLLTLYGIDDVAGYASMFEGRYARLMEAISGHEQSHAMADLWDGAACSPGMAALLGIRYPYTDPLGELPAAWGKHVASGDLNVYENAQALGRCFLVPRGEAEPGADEVLRRMLAPDFDPRAQALLEEPIPALPPGPVQGEIRDVDYTPNHFALTAQANRPCLMVCSDQYYPGWEATVDGVPTHVYRADYCFRALLLPPGTHRVEMRFKPRSFYLGRTISCGALLLCLAVLAISAPRPAPAAASTAR